MDQLGSEADASRKIDAVNPSTTNNNTADVLQGLTATLAQLAKASETQTATLASLKDDTLLRPDTDDVDEEMETGTSDTGINIGTALNEALVSSDTCVAKNLCAML